MPVLVDLTDGERLYVEARLRGLSLEASARAAGFKNPRSMSVAMEADERVVGALRRGREISSQATGVTRKTIEDMFLEAFRNAANATEQVMAARELGKLHGLYESTKTEVTHRLKQVAAESDLKSLPTEELERLTREQSSQVIEGEFQVIS